jgi:hypothetical protein
MFFNRAQFKQMIVWIASEIASWINEKIEARSAQSVDSRIT